MNPEAVREAVVVVWEASDRICGKRLHAALLHLVESMERHGHLHLDSLVRERLLSASASTLDRLLKPVRATAGSRRRRGRRKSLGRQVPVRTYNDWNEPPPGYLEIDLVAHCGGPLSGSFIHSLVVTDVCTGWTEAVPLLARDQSLVLAGLEAIRRQLPFPILGIDSDNDGAFINETLLEWTAKQGIEFTRSRAYRSNDQAYIEQKNGACRGAPVCGTPPLLGPLGRPDAGPALPVPAALRESLPALLQAAGKEQGRLSQAQTVQPSGYAL